MKGLRIHSLKTRSVVLFTAINLLLIVLVARFSYLFTRQLYLQQFGHQMNIYLNVIHQNIDPVLLDFVTDKRETLAFKQLQSRIEQWRTTLQVNNVFLFNGQFNVLSAFDFKDARTALLVYRPEIETLKQGKTFISHPFKGDDGVWYLWAFRRLTSDYYAGVRESAEQLASIDRLGWKFLFLALAGLGLTVIVALLFARSVHKPLDRLIAFSQRIGRGDFKTKAPESSLQEINTLSQALTAMRDELQFRESEKEQLLAQIAHELRNPLGGIELLAGLLKNELPAEGKHQQYLQQILKEINNLKTQISAFLSYSRPQEPHPETVDGQSVEAELKRRWEAMFQKRKVAFKVQWRAPGLQFDRGHLLQILNNLIANSLDAVPAEKGKVEVRAFTDNAKFIIEVRDNGQGVNSNNHEQWFKPFFTTKNDGFGLGLNVCKKLCRLNGAQIEAIARKEGGTVMRITVLKD